MSGNRDWRAFVRERLSLPGLTGRRERDVVEEVASQLEDLFMEAIAEGVTEADAEARVKAHVPDWEAFGTDLMKAERSRRRARGDQWSEQSGEKLREKGGQWALLADVLQDVRYCIRSLRSSPGFTTVALLTLALGIGGVATIFTVYDRVLIRPLPYENSRELVEMWEQLGGFGGATVSYPNFLDWRERNRVFEDLAAWNEGSVNVTGSGDPQEIDVIRTSASAFPLMRVSPALGRGFTSDDDRVGAPGVVILSHTYWRDHMGRDLDVIDRTLTFDGLPFTVIGVMPDGFAFPSRDPVVDAYVPIEQFAEGWAQNRGNHPGILVIGRTLRGVSLDAARQDMERVALELEAEFPRATREAGSTSPLSRNASQGALPILSSFSYSRWASSSSSPASTSPTSCWPVPLPGPRRWRSGLAWARVGTGSYGFWSQKPWSSGPSGEPWARSWPSSE